MDAKFIKDETLQGIANAIRAKAGTAAPIQTDRMADAINAISVGGGDSYKDLVWDTLQDQGKRTSYAHAFKTGWTDEIFTPKYDIAITARGALNMFDGTYIKNLKAALEKQGVTLDLGEATDVGQMFRASKVTHLPLLDLSSAVAANQVFMNCKDLEYIEGIRCSETTKIAANDSQGSFIGCTKLRHCIFSGTYLSYFGLKECPLDKESILSVFHVLSPEASGKYAAFSLAAVNTAFETSEGAADGSTSAEWTALVDGVPNWTITLS